MKKLFFILSILFIFSQTFITPVESPSVMKTLMARFEAFKQYLFQNKQVIPPIKITPIVFYYPKKSINETARITLINAPDNSPTVDVKLPSSTFQDVDSHSTFQNVDSYDFSPKKQYLLVHETKTEGPTDPRIGQSTNITRLIGTNIHKEIASFNNKIIMYEFSPDETTLLIAAPQKSRSKEFGGGEILRYNLFDISSERIITTFEKNIQSITYITANELFIKYNSGMEIVTIKKNQPFISIKTISTADDPYNIRTEYDEKQKNFTLQINNNPEQVYRSTISYHISPQNQYILIEQSSISATPTDTMGSISPSRTTTKLVNLISGNEIATFENLITHEFSQNERRLLVLCTQPITSSDYLYRLYDTTQKNTELMQCDKTTQSAYFSSPTELTIIDKDGKRIVYDSSMGGTSGSIQQKKQEPQAQQIALPQEQLSIEKRKTFTSPIVAAIENGFASIKQFAQKYLWPTTPEKKPEAQTTKQTTKQTTEPATKITEKLKEQTVKEPEAQTITKPETQTTEAPKEQTKQPTTIEPGAQTTTEITEKKEEFYEPEDIDTYMDSFAQNTSDKSSIITSIMEYLYFVDDKDDRDSLIANYKAYNKATQKQFASFFFAPPGGTLSIGLSTGTQDTHFTANVRDGLLSISNTRKPSTDAIIFTKKLDYVVKAITFNKDASYLALSYDKSRRIDIFKRTNDTFSEFKQLDLKEAQPIIGLNFIETENDTIYLFCLDESYALHIVTVTDQEESTST